MKSVFLAALTLVLFSPSFSNAQESLEDMKKETKQRVEEVEEMMKELRKKCPVKEEKEVPMAALKSTKIVLAEKKDANPAEVLLKVLCLPEYASVKDIKETFKISTHAGYEIADVRRQEGQASIHLASGAPEEFKINPCYESFLKDLSTKEFFKRPHGEMIIRNDTWKVNRPDVLKKMGATVR